MTADEVKVILRRAGADEVTIRYKDGQCTGVAVRSGPNGNAVALKSEDDMSRAANLLERWLRRTNTPSPV